MTQTITSYKKKGPVTLADQGSKGEGMRDMLGTMLEGSQHKETMYTRELCTGPVDRAVILQSAVKLESLV